MLLRLLMITKNYQHLARNSVKKSFFTRRAKTASAEGQSPPQVLDEGPRSGPHLLINSKDQSVLILLSLRISFLHTYLAPP